MIKQYPALLLALFSSFSSALTIDTMFLVSDDKGNGVITLTNDFEQRSFIQSYITELRVNAQGKLERIEYNETNIDDWKLVTSVPKFILDPGVSKDIGLRSLCLPEVCAKDKDVMYSVSFEPSPYFEEGEEQGSIVSINYGYAPIFVVPTPNPKISYELTNNGNTILAHNTGNTVLTVLIDQCTATVKNNCRLSEKLLAGRLRTINLPDSIQRNSLNVTVFNHDETYKRAEMLSLK